jgi:hypothetical protein
VGRTALKISLLFALFLSHALQAQDSVSIEGSVVDSVTKVGHPGVTVYFGSEQGAHQDAITDSFGKFQIVGMKEEQYGSHFERAGYIAQYSGTNDSAVKPVQVGKDPIRLRVELVALGTPSRTSS